MNWTVLVILSLNWTVLVWVILGLSVFLVYLIACDVSARPRWWTWPMDRVMERVNRRWGQ